MFGCEQIVELPARGFVQTGGCIQREQVLDFGLATFDFSKEPQVGKPGCQRIAAKIMNNWTWRVIRMMIKLGDKLVKALDLAEVVGVKRHVGLVKAIVS